VDATPAQRAAPEPVTVFAAAAPLAVVRTPPPPSGVSAPVDEDVGSRDEGLPPAELVPAGKAAAEDVVADRSSPAVASAPSAAPAHPAEVALARVDAGAAGDQAASPHPAEVALARVAEKDRARREALAAAAPPEREAVLAGRLALPGERDRAPLMFQPVFVPRTGPGLPPAPDPTRVLGPPLEERRDLRATRAD
jgi:hypothetical protein